MDVVGEEISEVENTKQQLKAEIKGLKTKLEQERRNHAAKVGQLEQTHQTELKKLQDSASAKIEEMGALLKDYNEVMKPTLDRCAELQAICDTKDADYKLLKDKYDDISDKHKHLSNRFNETIKRLCKAEARKKELERELKLAGESIDKLTNEKNLDSSHETERPPQHLDREMIGSQDKHINELADELSRLFDESKELDGKLEMAREDIDKLTKEKNGVVKEMRKKVRKIKRSMVNC